MEKMYKATKIPKKQYIYILRKFFIYRDLTKKIKES